MKKLFIFAALAALASCTTNEVFDENNYEIGFDAVTHKNTKAIIEGTTFPTTQKFDVYGFYAQNGIDYPATSNFMNGVEISYITGEDTWRNATNHYYWPLEGKVHFKAIYPASLTPTVTYANGFTLTDYTVGNDDILYAAATGSRAATAGSALAMQFNHALSLVEVQAKLNTTYAGATFSITKVDFQNIGTTGTGVLNVTNEDTPAASATWNITDKTQTLSYDTTEAAVSSTTATVYGAPKLVMPQTMVTTVGSESQLVLGYKLAQHGEEITGTLNIDITQEWEPSKKYIYTLNIKLDEILFNPSIATDWTTVEVIAIDIP